MTGCQWQPLEPEALGQGRWVGHGIDQVDEKDVAALQSGVRGRHEHAPAGTFAALDCQQARAFPCGQPEFRQRAADKR